MILANEIPRLEAIESVAMATRVAFGTGSLKKGSQETIRREWEREAKAGRKRPKPRRLPLPVFVSRLRRLGLAIELPAKASEVTVGSG